MGIPNFKKLILFIYLFMDKGMKTRKKKKNNFYFCLLIFFYFKYFLLFCYKKLILSLCRLRNLKSNNINKN